MLKKLYALFGSIFYIRISLSTHTWPKVKDRLTVRLLVDVELQDSVEDGVTHVFYAGEYLRLCREQNPFGLVDPWMIKVDSTFGAAERWWMDLVETGKAEIVGVD